MNGPNFVVSVIVVTSTSDTTLQVHAAPEHVTSILQASVETRGAVLAALFNAARAVAALSVPA